MGWVYLQRRDWRLHRMQQLDRDICSRETCLRTDNEEQPFIVLEYASRRSAWSVIAMSRAGWGDLGA